MILIYRNSNTHEVNFHN